MKRTKTNEGFMDFEHMLRQYFGDKSYGDQGLRNNPTAFWKELKGVIQKVEDKVLEIDTTSRHKSMILSEVERIRHDLEYKNEQTLVIHLFSLISRLLGFDYLKGYLNTPFYHQTSGQHHSQVILEGGDPLQHYHDEKNIIVIRKETLSHLKGKGYSDYKIAKIMNTSEYQIKKLKNNL